MSLEELCARTSREAPSGPMRETSIAPMLLAVCCSCRLIRDVTGPRPDDVRWVIRALSERGYLDDARFAEQFVRDRASMRGSHRGPRSETHRHRWTVSPYSFRPGPDHLLGGLPRAFAGGVPRV